jgi:hypothetical protein
MMLRADNRQAERQPIEGEMSPPMQELLDHVAIQIAVDYVAQLEVVERDGAAESTDAQPRETP